MCLGSVTFLRVKKKYKWGVFMYICDSSDDEAAKDWEQFVNGEERFLHQVPDIIIESWERCQASELSPLDDRRHQSLDNEAFQASLASKEKLIEVAHPFMTNLYKFVKGTSFVVVLANEEGYILEMFADDDVWKNPLTRNFFLGASWQECVAGTNAIGTAVVLKEAIQVSGAQHYCQKHHCLTCSAAPIFDIDGKLIGIIDISGPYHASHVHTLGMVVAAAEAINAQIRIQNKNHLLAVANKKMINFFNMVSDGVLIVGTDGLISETNPAAETLLGINKLENKKHYVNDFIQFRTHTGNSSFCYDKPCSYVESIIETLSGQTECLASSEPYYDENDLYAGSFITLKPIKQVQKLVNRIGGYTASLQFSDIIGNSPELREVIRLANLSAINNSNVLLTGESGTGKEIFAQAIHNKSNQSTAPFIPLNCGAIPRDLIGSELFGYEEGAFTGAKKGGRPGKFELASGGTLFLDEIGDMPLEHQTVLLRVIQEKQMMRIGGDKLIPVQVRLICATNKNLMEEVEKGTFRRDLFYRLNVMAFMIPPLRSRVEDIPLLFQHFLKKLCSDRERQYHVDNEVYQCLKAYNWPGNVRELQNVVERAVNLAEHGVISLQHLPVSIQKSTSVQSEFILPRMENLQGYRQEKQKKVQETEKSQILALLDLHSGNVTKVALEMGFSRKTIYNKMKQYDIFY